MKMMNINTYCASLYIGFTLSSNFSISLPVVSLTCPVSAFNSPTQTPQTIQLLLSFSSLHSYQPTNPTMPCSRRVWHLPCGHDEEMDLQCSLQSDPRTSTLVPPLFLPLSLPLSLHPSSSPCLFSFPFCKNSKVRHQITFTRPRRLKRPPNPRATSATRPHRSRNSNGTISRTRWRIDNYRRPGLS